MTLSRLAFHVMDRFVADNEPLKGDLLEAFQAGRSPWWLWRQVIAAVISHPNVRLIPDLVLLATAIVALISFEAVLVTNLFQRMLLGPPADGLTGYLHRAPQSRLNGPAYQSGTASTWNMIPMLFVFLSVPIGWLGTRFRMHYSTSLVTFALSVFSCAALNLHAPLVVQFAVCLVFVLGLLIGGRLADNPRPVQQQ